MHFFEVSRSVPIFLGLNLIEDIFELISDFSPTDGNKDGNFGNAGVN